jgi:hypothetical protein
VSWNPNSPDTLGLEWQPHHSGLTYLDASSKVSAERFRSSATETVDSVKAYLRDLTPGGLLTAEVFTAGQETAGEITYLENYPRTDTGKTVTDFYDAGAGTVNFDDVDDRTTDVDGAWNNSNASVSAYLAFRMGAGGLASYAGKRIVRVDIFARWLYIGGTGVTGQAVLTGPDGNVWPVSDAVSPPLGTTYRSDRIAKLDVNPFTGLPWTAAEIDTYFSTGSTKAAGVYMRFNTLVNAVRISAIWARVQYIDENRLAYGYFSTDDSPGDGWKTFALTEPDGSAGWAKANGVSYTVALRRVNDTGRAGWPFLTSDVAAPHAEHGSYDAAAVEMFGRIVDLGTLRTRLRPLRMILGSSDSTADSQPYAILTAVPVQGGVIAQQLVTPAADDYGFLRVLARPAETSTAALPDLTLRIVRNSDSNIMGSVDVPRSDADALPDVHDGWKSIEVNLDSAVTLAAVAYRLEAVCSGASGGEAWEVFLVDTVSAGGSSFGGSSSYATWASLPNTGADLAFTLSTVPDAPTGFDVTLVS